jgi:aerobic carbon-monoxide dehydrogenase medium subunit
MKPAPFAYHRASTVEEALSLLAEGGWEAKLLAGGQSLVPAMNFRLAQPAVLIDLNPIPDLDYIREEDGMVRIGALARQSALERSPLLASRAPLITEAMPHVAHPQIRNRGTLGGTLAHADPAAELPAVTLALGARLVLQGPDGRRTVDAADFFTGLFGTALGEGEMIVEVEVPALPPHTGWAFDEIARRHGDYGLAGLACTVTLGESGSIAGARLALLGVGDGPVLAEEASAVLEGARPSPQAFAAAAEAAAAALDPPADIHASADYRRRLVEVLVRRQLPRAVARAGAAE